MTSTNLRITSAHQRVSKSYQITPQTTIARRSARHKHPRHKQINKFTPTAHEQVKVKSPKPQFSYTQNASKCERCFNFQQPIRCLHTRHTQPTRQRLPNEQNTPGPCMTFLPCTVHPSSTFSPLPTRPPTCKVLFPPPVLIPKKVSSSEFPPCASNPKKKFQEMARRNKRASYKRPLEIWVGEE